MKTDAVMVSNLRRFDVVESWIRIRDVHRDAFEETGDPREYQLATMWQRRIVRRVAALAVAS